MPREKSRAAAAVSRVWDEDDRDAADFSPGTTDTSTEAAIRSATDDPQPTEELGELIDGGEDEITDDFEERINPAPVAVAVDGVDHPQAADRLAADAMKKEVSPMPSNKDMTKADHVRAEIERRQKSGESMRPKDIIEALAKKGVKVTPPQVSVLVKKLVGPASKLAPTDQTPAQKAKAAINRLTRAASAVKKPISAAPVAKKPVTAPSAARSAGKTKAAPQSSDSEYSTLFAAANFVGACGDLAAARKTLEAYERLTAARA
jgi:hypothetical protein